MPCSSLYIHVPFCVSKCPYCDFYSVPYTQTLAQAYTIQLCKALETVPFALSSLDTIYFGGGTPSLLSGQQIGQILEAASRFGISQNAEITVECNPGTIDAKGFESLWSSGVNRISMGLQSADDRLLRILGRKHTLAQAEHAIDWVFQAGFSNLSLDLMLGLPEQNAEDIIRSVRFCRAHGASHVSAYLLKVEDGTPFAAPEVLARCPEEDAQADFYTYAIRALEAHGFFQYEISNFARTGHISRHNYKCWDAQEYLGLGPAAHSFVDGRRFSFPRSLGRLLRTDNFFENIVEEGLGGDPEEYIMLRLRLREGILWNELKRRYPDQDLRKHLEEGAQLIGDSTLVECDQRGVRLTPQGFPVSNCIISILAP